jgi:nicotinate-nucleotide adenylyltransferase
MARAALDELKLDKILWMPTGSPRYRKPAVASPEHRLAMLRLALGSESRYEIDARELAPQASAYTVDALQGLRAELGPQATLYLLLGADQYSKFETWHRPRDVERLARIAVFARPGFAPARGDAIHVAFEPLAISGSEIRARAARGEDISALMPAPVANYIARHGLYA